MRIIAHASLLVGVVVHLFDVGFLNDEIVLVGAEESGVVGEETVGKPNGGEFVINEIFSSRRNGKW